MPLQSQAQKPHSYTWERQRCSNIKSLTLFCFPDGELQEEKPANVQTFSCPFLKTKIACCLPYKLRFYLQTVLCCEPHRNTCSPCLRSLLSCWANPRLCIHRGTPARIWVTNPVHACLSEDSGIWNHKRKFPKASKELNNKLYQVARLLPYGYFHCCSP